MLRTWRMYDPLVKADGGGLTHFVGLSEPVGARKISAAEVQRSNCDRKMAGAAGLEPVTSAVTGQRSNQLSYAPAMGNETIGNVWPNVKFWMKKF